MDLVIRASGAVIHNKGSSIPGGNAKSFGASHQSKPVLEQVGLMFGNVLTEGGFI